MPISLAKAVATNYARKIYLDPAADWSKYGAGACKRRSRSKVRCLVAVTEDVYNEDDGTLSDSIICGAYADVSYDRWDRISLWTSKPECFWESEI
ncbi:MAG: hypothetical protein M9938_01265 [Solirubrobacterales bacterium]|nr:hypothetical protein [Solirubrobacterales bacterium]